LANANDTSGMIPNEQWDALLRAPIIDTECAFFEDPETAQERIVVIYNARNVPPVVTIDVNSNQSLVTLKADGAPLAVMSCHSTEVPSAEDVVLVARHAPQNA
jgi:hypothetical protein